MRIFKAAAARWCCGALLALAVLLPCGVASAADCVPMPDRVQLHALDSEDLKLLAINRWTKCGWDQAEPVMRRWREVAREDWRRQQQEDGLPASARSQALENDFVFELLELLSINPAELYSELRDVSQMPVPGDPPALSDILLLNVEPTAPLRNVEAGVPAAVEFLRRDFRFDTDLALELELVLVKHEVRSARLDAARARLERAEKAWRRQAAAEADVPDSIAKLHRVLAPVAPVSPVASRGDWKLYRLTRTEFCGTREVMERRYGVSYLRDYVLQLADPGDALNELLDTAWRGEINGGSRHTMLLVQLLRQRHDEAALEQGWREALASIRADDAVVGLTFLGRFLPLPYQVVEDGDSAGTTRERALSVQELAELVQATPLYRVMQRPL